MKGKLVVKAVHAHTNLNVYGSIIAILEGGCLYGGREATAQKIIKLCKAEMQKELHRYDAAISKIGEKP